MTKSELRSKGGGQVLANRAEGSSIRQTPLVVRDNESMWCLEFCAERDEVSGASTS